MYRVGQKIGCLIKNQGGGYLHGYSRVIIRDFDMGRICPPSLGTHGGGDKGPMGEDSRLKTDVMHKTSGGIVLPQGVNSPLIGCLGKDIVRRRQNSLVLGTPRHSGSGA